MTINSTPTIDEFRPMVLRVLADGAILPFHQICEAVADYMELDATVRAEQIPSGRPRYVNRIRWACSALTWSGLLNRPKRGHYMITDDGRKVDARCLSSYSEKDMLEWPAWKAYQNEIGARNREDSIGIDVDFLDQTQSPIEVMEHNEQSFNHKVETELRQRLQESSPEFFERAVIDLLWAMGYGGTKGEKKHVGRSHDGGIDGVISQDSLGLTNIYIQAKRYADSNKIGDHDIRNFIGSLDAKGATLGVFVTTSSFLPKAKETAANCRHGRIILIDGKALTRYMLNYGVAVQKKQEFILYEIDDDFFDEDII